MVAHIVIWDGDTTASGIYLSDGMVQLTVQDNTCRRHLLHQLKAINFACMQRILARLASQELRTSYALCTATCKSQIAVVPVADHLLILPTDQGTSHVVLVRLVGPLATSVA